jgi:hypothetical protein
MIFEKPDARRALRSILQGIVVLVLLWLSWHLSDRLTTEDGLREVARWTLGIIGMGTVGYIIENGIRSVKGSAFGATFDVQGGEDDKP